MSDDNEYSVNGVRILREEFLRFLKQELSGPIKTKVPSMSHSKYSQRLKMEAYAAYGGAICSCCGEKEISFLSLEHSRQDGASWRKVHGSGVPFYEWLKRRNYPKNVALEVLCMNCQFGRRFNGGLCPHSHGAKQTSLV